MGSSVKYELRPYQVEDVAFYINHPKCMNLSDPATGKTPSVCAYIGDYLWARKNVKTVWAMPKSLLEKNEAELLRFSHLEPWQVQVVDGPPEVRAAQLRTRAPVLLMGFDRLAEDRKVILEDPAYRACVVDELHLGYGGPESNRTAEWWRFMRRMWYFVGMTGTLIDGRLSSAYPIIQVIAPQIYGNYQFFQSRHEVKNLDGLVVDWKGHDFLANILGQFSVRHTFEEIYGEENKMVEVQDCELSEEHLEAYLQMEQEALLDLGEDWLEAVNDGVKAIRCRQILAHPETFGLDYGETDKDKRLKEHLSDLKESQEPAVIFSALIPELDRVERICKEMDLTVARIDGNVSNRGELDRDFREGKYQIMVATPATAGVGFNWDHVDTMIFTSIDYKDSNWVQAIRRAIRGMRLTPLKVWLLRYPGTVEDKIIRSIERKSASAHKVDPTNKIIEIVKRNTKGRRQVWTPPETATGLSMAVLGDDDEEL